MRIIFPQSSLYSVPLDFPAYPNAACVRQSRTQRLENVLRYRMSTRVSAYEYVMLLSFIARPWRTVSKPLLPARLGGCKDFADVIPGPLLYRDKRICGRYVEPPVDAPDALGINRGSAWGVP